MSLERDVLHAVLATLPNEHPDLVLVRNTVGLTKEWDAGTHATRTITYGLGRGSADLIGCLAGRFFALEVKSAGGRLRPEQRAWAALWRSKGAFVATVRSVDEARAAVARARAGACE